MSKKIYKGVNAVVIKTNNQDELNDLLDEIEEIEHENKNKNRVKEIKPHYGYLAHHFFPDIAAPQRFPDFLAFPTHIHTEKTDFILPASSDGRIALYVNPAITIQNLTLVSLLSGQEPYAEKYVWLAYNNAQNITSVDGNGNGIVDSNYVYFKPFYNALLKNWPVQTIGVDNGSNLLRSRLLSCQIKIKYIGKPLEASGNIRCGMNILTPIAGVLTLNLGTGFYIKDLANFPIYGSFDVGKNIVLNYRHLENTFYNLGPYDNASGFPYFLIYGDNISNTSSFKIEITRTFESIVNKNMMELTNPVREQPNSGGSSFIKDRYGDIDVPAILSEEDYNRAKWHYMRTI